MSLPIKYTLSLYAGDDKNFIIRYKNENGSAVDLTGYSAEMHLKQELCTTATLEITGVIDDPTTGEIVFAFTGAETEALIIDCLTTCYLYDVQLTEPGGDILTILRGTVRVIQDVTT